MDADERQMQNRQYPVEEDICLQRRIWRFERLGWYVLVLIVVMTLCGLFSNGLLSTTTVASQQRDLIVKYERFHRSGAVNTMVIKSHGEPGAVHTLLIGSAQLEGFAIDSIQPQPIRSAGTRNGLKLTLPGDDHGDSILYLAWRSDGVGLYDGKISVEGGGEVPIIQFIYP